MNNVRQLTLRFLCAARSRNPHSAEFLYFQVEMPSTYYSHARRSTNNNDLEQSSAKHCYCIYLFNIIIGTMHRRTGAHAQAIRRQKKYRKIVSFVSAFNVFNVVM